MKANDSLECRNCHGYDYMDFTRQSPRAAFMHSTYLATNEKTCVDCHKRIARRLPDVTLTTDTSPRQDPLTHPAVADSAGEASGARESTSVAATR
jgi:cytochrome c-type protein NapC